VFMKNNVLKSGVEVEVKVQFSSEQIQIHDVLNVLLKPTGLFVVRNLKLNKCELAYIDSLNKTVMISEDIIDRFVRVRDYMIHNFFTNRASSELNSNKNFIALGNLHRNVELRLNILNIVSLHFDLLLKIDLYGRFWMDCIFYTFDAAIYGAFINRYRHKKESYDVMIDPLVTVNEGDTLVLALVLRLDSLFNTFDNSTWLYINGDYVRKCLYTTISNYSFILKQHESLPERFHAVLDIKCDPITIRTSKPLKHITIVN